MSHAEQGSWRLAICHTTGYRYEGVVGSSYNEARITPLTTDRQVVLEASVEVQPSTSVFRYWDYWGAITDAFDIHQPHTELVVTATSLVETSPAPGWPNDHMGWADLAAPELADRFTEFLTETAYAPAMAETSDVARSMVAEKAPAEAARAVGDWVRQRLQYRKGSTEVSTTAANALALGNGVCQDFAHVALVVLRAAGIPSRYVSGYIHPSSAPEIGVTVAGQSHAWVEFWLGDWYPLDPTHDEPVGHRHVVVARGRDYADVSPLKGIYHGLPAKSLDVTVEVTREA